jgi:hypothetical protein
MVTMVEAPSVELLGLLAHVWGDGRPRLRQAGAIDVLSADVVEMQGFGARVRERRIGHGWSIMEAAHRAGIPPNNWQLIEQGALGLRRSWAVRMAGAVHADVGSLIGRAWR